jgi:hypothetical protein
LKKVGREVGSEVDAPDALESLYPRGLVHRKSDDFVLLEAAARPSELQL